MIGVKVDPNIKKIIAMLCLPFYLAIKIDI
jgi:hypothetical protein